MCSTSAGIQLSGFDECILVLRRYEASSLVGQLILYWLTLNLLYMRSSFTLQEAAFLVSNAHIVHCINQDQYYILSILTMPTPALHALNDKTEQCLSSFDKDVLPSAGCVVIMCTYTQQSFFFLPTASKTNAVYKHIWLKKINNSVVWIIFIVN